MSKAVKKNSFKNKPKKTSAGKKKKSGCLHRIWAVFSIGIALSLIISRLSEFVSPEKIWVFGFFGLLFPFFMLLNVVLLLWYAIRRRKLFFIHLVSILLSFMVIYRYYQPWHRSRKELAKDGNFTILSYNVRTFNQFYKKESIRYLDSLAGFIKTVSPSVICFQEYYNDKEGKIQIEDYFKNELGYNNSHIYIFKEKNKRHEFGIATFSKYPIVNRGKILNVNYSAKNQTGNFAIYTDIAVQGKIIRVYNIHLESNRLSSEDIFFATEEEINLPPVEKLQQKSRIILSKLRKSLILRSRQVTPIAQEIRTTQMPIFVCGDFNDIPESWVYRTISGGLTDAFREAGSGSGTTYNSKFPLLRIDYIFHSKSIKTLYYNSPRVYFSDHFPVYAVCKLP